MTEVNEGADNTEAKNTEATPAEDTTQEQQDDFPSLTDDGKESETEESGDDSSTAEKADDGEEKGDDEQESDDDQVIEYEAFEFPEGMEINEPMLEQFKGVASELKLDQEGAQKLASMYAGVIQDQMKAQHEAHAQTIKGWRDEVRADPDIGGDKLNESVGIAKAALNEYGSPELVELLNGSGLGDNPAVIRAFYKIGQHLNEGKLHTGKPSSKVSAASRWYGNSTSNEES